VRKTQKETFPLTPLTEAVRGRLADLRTARELSVRQLVEAMHTYGATTSRSALSNFATGLRDDISLTEAVALALVLDVELADLITDPAQDGRRWIAVGERQFTDNELRAALGATDNAGLTADQVRTMRRALVGLLDQYLTATEKEWT
jgi:transcriptional regulator with XRE-family HTH domain